MNKVLAGALAGLAMGAFSAAAALDIDISAGNGWFFAGDFGGGLRGISRTDGGQKSSTATPWLGGGVHGFFDATYGEIGLSLTAGGGKPQYTSGGATLKDTSNILGFMSLGISVLGKYPFALTDKITVFPAAGIEWAVVLAGGEYEGVNKDRYRYDGVINMWDGGNYADKAGDFGALWFKFGGGADFFVTEPLFLRPEILYGIRLANKVESDAVKDIKRYSGDAGTLLGHGLTIKASVGYKF